MTIKAGRIRERRTQLGWSQEELAARLRTDQKQISKWEHGRGNPTAQTLILLAEVLEVTIDWLVGISETPDCLGSYDELNDVEREAIAILRSKPPDRRRELLEILRLSAK